MASLWGEEEGDDDSLNNNGDGEEDILDMDGGADIHLEGALLMRFCPHDSSMLYPQVHNENSNSIVEYGSNEIQRYSILTNCTSFRLVKSRCGQEDKRRKSLRYACRLCRYNEDAPDQPLVYRNERKKEIGNILHTVPSAVSDDPTLARSNKIHCTNCGHNEAVFFQSDVAQSDSLALIFVCCNCDHKWMN
jgi:DNA-directed RNA polymerase II subunit RPB9